MSNDSTFIDLIREQSAPLAPIATKLNPSTKPLKGIRHIAFDVYGTLFTSGVGDIGNSSSQHHGDAISTVLSAEGLTSLPSAPELSKLYRSAIRNSQQESTDNGALRAEVEIREVWKEVLQHLNVDFQNFPASKIAEIALRFELAVNPVWPMPDLVPVLDLLAMQLAPYSIVSNAQFFTPLLFPALTGKSLSELHIQESTCIWSFEQREAKPSTRLFETLLERLHPTFKPAEVLYVGNDMLNDISAAKAAGLRTALFAGDQRSLRLRTDHADCQNLQPDLTLTQLSDLTKLV
tara:strand:+ start:9814 stop:10689 length:876 start_codon:yes stop_codon:yes gene_type:complete